MILIIIWWLTEKKHLGNALVIYLLSIIWLSFEIYLLYMSPYGTLVLEDSEQYKLFSQALVEHWRGNDVYISEYSLPGLSRENPTWKADAYISYAKIFLSVHYLYEVYLGIFQYLTDMDLRWVLVGNVLFLAAVPVITFNIAGTIFEEKRYALFAGGLTLLDPSFAGVGVYIIKDSLTVFLVSILLLVSIKILNDKPSFRMLLLFAVFIVLTAISRYPAIIGVYGGLVFFLLLMKFRNKQPVARLVVVMIAAFIMTGYAHYQNKYFEEMFTVNPYPILKTLKNKGEINFNDKVNVSDEAGNSGRIAGSQKETRTDEPVTAEDSFALRIAKSITHTLFAPYPWTIISSGVQYKFSELFIPGVTMWILALPFVVFFLFRASYLNAPEILFLVSTSAIIMFLYIVGYGEFSTRHRVFLLPVYWVLATAGFRSFSIYVKNYRKS